MSYRCVKCGEVFSIKEDAAIHVADEHPVSVIGQFADMLIDFGIIELCGENEEKRLPKSIWN